MAGLKEIRRRIKSVSNTKKITYAMKLVSAAKLRKTQEAVQRSRAYTDALLGVLSDIIRSRGGAAMEHPLMNAKPNPKKIHLFILGGARGLCGAYNTNVNRRIEAFYKERAAQGGVSISATIFGKKPAEYFRRMNRGFLDSFEALPDDPQAWPTDPEFLKLQDKFLAGEIDELYLVYTRFKSAITVIPTVEKLLPLESIGEPVIAGKEKGSSGVTLYEPSEAAVYDALIPRLLSSRIRQAALDSKASEHASRMTAMDAASKNASDLLFNLTLTRNRLRQSGITNQLLDIVGGAEALN